MKKLQRIFALLLSLILVLSFLGCSKQNSAAPTLPSSTTAPTTPSDPTNPSEPTEPTKPNDNGTENDSEEDEEKEDEEKEDEEKEDEKPASGITYENLEGNWITELNIADLVKADLIATTPEDEEEIEGVFDLIDSDDLTIHWQWEFFSFASTCTLLYDEDEFAVLIETFAERYFDALYEYYEDEIDASYDEYYAANFEETYDEVIRYFEWDWPMSMEIFSYKCEDGEVFFDASVDEWMPADISLKGETLTIKSMDTDILTMSDTLYQVMFPLKLTSE